MGVHAYIQWAHYVCASWDEVRARVHARGHTQSERRTSVCVRAVHGSLSLTLTRPPPQQPPHTQQQEAKAKEGRWCGKPRCCRHCRQASLCHFSELRPRLVFFPSYYHPQFRLVVLLLVAALTRHSQSCAVHSLVLLLDFLPILLVSSTPPVPFLLLPLLWVHLLYWLEVAWESCGCLHRPSNLQGANWGPCLRLLFDGRCQVSHHQSNGLDWLCSGLHRHHCRRLRLDQESLQFSQRIRWIEKSRQKRLTHVGMDSKRTEHLPYVNLLRSS
ncbi:hypothetical protein ECC02_002275 [Trypanosoma cruzi]|uniref:Uncharacterized protein n=1 Tax=Trypanosoma cruzi TaxID=5693 RepID=A0A7J6YE04_TRYCR|nr:hypothetical protein ECC02_002275 [Trypanosoma cruzi]